MDVYQETYELIEAKINKEEGKNKKSVQEPELDMYADDFDVKEKEKLKGFYKKIYYFIFFIKILFQMNLLQVLKKTNPSPKALKVRN